MADNYLEKKMEDYKAKPASTAKSRPSFQKLLRYQSKAKQLQA